MENTEKVETYYFSNLSYKILFKIKRLKPLPQMSQEVFRLFDSQSRFFHTESSVIPDSGVVTRGRIMAALSLFSSRPYFFL